MRTTPGPRADGDIPAYVRSLGLPGLADVHVHFLPERLMRRVWEFFDGAEQSYGRAWPITYRTSEQARLRLLRSFGLVAVPALTYAHRPGMAEWLNAWGADFARRTPDALHCATLFPEPEVGTYVRRALAEGARLFKVHVQVGGFAPDNPLLDDAWAAIEEAGVPVVMHAGSGPRPGRHTGPQPVHRLLARYPHLRLVIAHLGMPEYDAFADLAEEHADVHLDTTMVATDFTNAFAPLPESYLARLPALVDRIVLGSDFPNIPYPYAHQLATLARLDLGDDWMRRVLWHNGARLLGLVTDESATTRSPSGQG